MQYERLPDSGPRGLWSFEPHVTDRTEWFPSFLGDLTDSLVFLRRTLSYSLCDERDCKWQDPFSVLTDARTGC